MDQAALVMDEIEAGANLIREFNQSAPVKAAFWLKADEEDYRFLYLCSDRFDEANHPWAYGELQRIMRQKPSIFLNPFRVNLISGEDRLAVAAKQISDQYPDRLGTRLHSQTFGNTFIVDAYIYPSPISEKFPKSF